VLGGISSYKSNIGITSNRSHRGGADVQVHASVLLVAVMLLAMVPVFTAPVLAGGPNLLQNPGFERPYVPMAVKENCRIASSWVPYYDEGALYETMQDYRLAPEYKAAYYWEAPGNRVRSGELSQQYFHSFGNFEGGVF
jgi:hypothetical protein